MCLPLLARRFPSLPHKRCIPCLITPNFLSPSKRRRFYPTTPPRSSGCPKLHIPPSTIRMVFPYLFLFFSGGHFICIVKPQPPFPSYTEISQSFFLPSYFFVANVDPRPSFFRLQSYHFPFFPCTCRPPPFFQKTFWIVSGISFPGSEGCAIPIPLARGHPQRAYFSRFAFLTVPFADLQCKYPPLPPPPPPPRPPLLSNETSRRYRPQMCIVFLFSSRSIESPPPPLLA